MKVYTTWDSQFQTWNIMSFNNECLFYGTIVELENEMVKQGYSE